MLWASVAAAATGIVAVIAIAKLKERVAEGADVVTRLRDVSDVLADCYRKLDEIEMRLPTLAPLVGHRSVGLGGVSP